MVITTDRFMIRSRSANLTYWEQDVYPDWTALRTYRHFPDGLTGTGVEPHYHDNDELWLFTAGRGEVWLDGIRYEITPNTMVYTPMGCVHRFQMFTPYENNAIVTRLERDRRPIHITVEAFGPPAPTAPGFVVPGGRNTGPIPDPGPRCPLTEWRLMELAAGAHVETAAVPRNEHWLVLSGAVHLEIDGWSIELWPQDIALLRGGTVRAIRTEENSRVVVAREKEAVQRVMSDEEQRSKGE
jgi:mannose-6-phosphate isomerase-like protein (cupin superfamily)